MAKKDSGETQGIIVYLGVIGGVIVANLLRLRPLTRAAAMPSVNPPVSFNTLSEVALRFDEVKTLYRSGVLGFQETRDQLASLIDAAFKLETQGKADAAPVTELVDKMSAFHDETYKTEQDITATSGVPA